MGMAQASAVTIQHQANVSGAAVETTGLTRRFGDLVAVDHVDLTVPRGTTFGRLLGRNGAGKTTMIKLLITLQPTSEGTARVGGYDVATQPQQVRRHVGYVPQLLSADGSLTAWETCWCSLVSTTSRAPSVGTASSALWNSWGSPSRHTNWCASSPAA
jgi:ABC-type Mn2+/Zn2+ transport system ATPase subunit